MFRKPGKPKGTPKTAEQRAQHQRPSSQPGRLKRQRLRADLGRGAELVKIALVQRCRPSIERRGERERII